MTADRHGVLVVVETQVEADIMRRVLDGARFRLGDRAPDCLTDPVILSVRGRSVSPAITAVALADDAALTQLMDRNEVAARLGVSPSTVSRMVAAGTLTKIGRRITRASVDRIGADHV